MAKAFVLFYAGKPVGLITHPETVGGIGELCETISPDEGDAAFVEVEGPTVGDAVQLVERTPVPTELLDAFDEDSPQDF